MSATLERVEVVRRFGRFYTSVLGLLRSGLLDTDYSLTEARIIFELGQREHTEMAQLRAVLNLDPGYLSRVMKGLEEKDLLFRERSSSDARRQVVSLSEEGRGVFDLLDRRSTDQVHGILADLSEDQQRKLVTAMKEIEAVLRRDAPPKPVFLRTPRAGDFGWVVERHGQLYAHEYGWDETFESLVARIVAEYVEHPQPDRQAAWIADVDGDRMGCVFCMQKSIDIAQLRLLLVEPSARGLGIGSRLVDECIHFARRAGYDKMMLWTNDVLHAARHIYEKAGFELTEEEPHRSFGRDLVGQNWWLTL